MNLKSLSDSKLIEATDSLVKTERELLAQVLHHLREIERRRLFSALGYPSLFAYAVQRLGYAEDQAHRRISAMRLLREIPELEEKIESGAINLTQLGLARSAFKRQEFPRQAKVALIQNLEGKSTRESETLILAAAPLPTKPEKARADSASTVRLEFSMSSEAAAKIEELKALMAHAHPGISLGELFEHLCDLAISKKKTAAPRVRRLAEASTCENCGSEYAIEKDHRQPKALGGTDEPENLRLLCRHCNQRAAIEVYGVEKMEPYLTPHPSKFARPQSEPLPQARESSSPPCPHSLPPGKIRRRGGKR